MNRCGRSNSIWLIIATYQWLSSKDTSYLHNRGAAISTSVQSIDNRPIPSSMRSNHHFLKRAKEKVVLPLLNSAATRLKPIRASSSHREGELRMYLTNQRELYCLYTCSFFMFTFGVVKAEHGNMYSKYPWHTQMFYTHLHNICSITSTPCPPLRAHANTHQSFFSPLPPPLSLWHADMQTPFFFL